ncbi:toll/interleukin-1 receptor domain-containing protein, partial [Shewanella sp. A25]|nr:toll/interleukin-1 receptor domain-containing protein [Shewanella shenzhenensis]
KLLRIGIRPWLDKWDLIPGDTILDALEKAVKSNQCGALFFGPADIGNWHIMEVRAYVEKWANKTGRLIPVILPGVEGTPELPIWIQQTL